jgi:hypothetical protein
MFETIICFLYSILALLVGYFYYSQNKRERHFRYFMPALIFKILASFAYVWVYINVFYYTGDTFGYMGRSVKLTNLILRDFNEGIVKLLSPATLENFYGWNYWYYNPETAIVLKFTSIINIFSLNTDYSDQPYYATTLLFSLLSFIGIWNFYQFLVRRNYALYKEFAYCILFLPSIVFWASGVMKDTLVLAFMGVFLYNLDEVFIKKNLNPFNIFLLAFSFYVFATAKAYVAFALIPSLLLWVIWDWKERFKNPVLKTIFTPIFIGVAIPALAGAIVYLGKSFDRFSVDNVFDEAIKFQDYHGSSSLSESGAAGWGSSYTLGNFDGSASGALKMFFPAVNVALFRPYPWEAKKPQVMLAAMESLFLLLFTFRIFWRIGFFGFFRVLFTRPYAMGAFSFAIIFAFAVGFTSYNFGALSRYRIPLLPFFMSALFIMNYEVNFKKMSKREKLKFQKSMIKKGIKA